MVFYRKYRPQIIGELDSQHVRDTLYSVLFKNTSHAFLFTGPKGLGKTSTARIVAKVVNCTGRNKESGIKNKGINGKKADHKDHNSSYIIHNSDNIEPCGNKCEQCISITNGTNLDVLEIDAASNRGIDEIRDLKDKIHLAPLSAKTKVYIIDEVHMLTTEAFNALLKTLEEPPPHAMFILCTTEPHKVPATILSRCTHIAFETATEEELIRSFKE
jgi:DNA polymerase-3 subunit gamma/tau